MVNFFFFSFYFDYYLVEDARVIFFFFLGLEMAFDFEVVMFLGLKA